VIAVMTTDLSTLDAGRRFIRGVFADGVRRDRTLRIVARGERLSPFSLGTASTSPPLETPISRCGRTRSRERRARSEPAPVATIAPAPPRRPSAAGYQPVATRRAA